MDNDRSMDYRETQYINERSATELIRREMRAQWRVAIKARNEEIARLFGEHLPTEWVYEKFDLGGLEFWGGPQRSFFESLSAEQCFEWLAGTAKKYPEGVGCINPNAVRGKVSEAVYKFDGQRGQLWLAWMWTTEAKTAKTTKKGKGTR